jgi:hypothetical protein
MAAFLEVRSTWSVACQDRDHNRRHAEHSDRAETSTGRQANDGRLEVTLAEQQISKPNGHGGVVSSMRESFLDIRDGANDALQKFARSPKITLPVGRQRIQVITDRVRAKPAVSPSVSMNIGFAAIGLGVWGTLFPGHVKRTLGIRAPDPLVQTIFGARELWSGYSLAGDPTKSGVLWARVLGDIFDVAALKALDHAGNPKRGNARTAMGFVLAVTALDVVTAVRMSAVQRNCA